MTVTLVSIKKRVRRFKSVLNFKLERRLLPSSSEKQVIVFIHLPKCGGITMGRLMRRNYDPLRVLKYDISGRRSEDGRALSFECGRSSDIRKIIRFLKSNQDKIECVVGHIPYGIHQFIERDCFYFSIVREPVSRVWSQFQAILRNKNHYLYPTLAKHGFDLEKILRSGEVFEFCNDQARMILGTSRVNLGKNDIDPLLEHVEENISHISPLVNFKQSLVLLQNTFHWKDIHYKNENVGQYNEAPPDNLASFVKEMNMVDWALYEYATRHVKMIPVE